MFCSRGSPFAPSFSDYDYALARQHAYEQRRREAILLARQREAEEAEYYALLRAQAQRREQAELARRRQALEEHHMRQAALEEHRLRQARSAQREAAQRRQRRQQLDRAAAIIQRAVRAHLAAKPRHGELDRIASDFVSASSSFTLPSASDLVLTDNGSLAFVPANTPLRAHEEALTRLLTRLDAVDSAGNPHVRQHRRELVLAIERELEGIEALKVAARDARAPVIVDTPADLSSAVVVPISGHTEAVEAVAAGSIAADAVMADGELVTADVAPTGESVDTAVLGKSGELDNGASVAEIAALVPAASPTRARSPSLHSVSSEQGYEMVE